MSVAALARFGDNHAGKDIVPAFSVGIVFSGRAQRDGDPDILEHLARKTVEILDHPQDESRERNRMSKQQNPEDTKKHPPTFSAEDARQGEIILRKRWQRWVFVAGLIGIVLLAFLLGLKLS